MRYISCAVLVAAAYGCGSETQVTQPLEAVAPLALATEYEIVKLGSLGGTISRGMAINDAGSVAGWSTLPDGSRRAVRWLGTTAVSLGTLGGPGSSSMVPWPGQNNTGTIVGISHTDHVDLLGENWSCEEGGFLPETNRVCRGFVWENGEMRELPTFGGPHGFAAGVNDQGEVVGWAELEVLDPTCDLTTTQRRRFRAAIWYPKVGSNDKIKIRELPPFGDDATSAATAINNNGQAVGISGRCDQAVGRFSAQHAVIWDKSGKVSEIPNLGGTTWHTPMDINEHGDVTGFSNPPGTPDLTGGFIAQAFHWSYGATTVTPIGTLDGDPFSQGMAINAHGQVVGVSFGDAVRGARAFIWENGVLTNLNVLFGAANGDVYLSAQDINDAGQITGRMRDGATGNTVAFVATPIN